MYSGEQMDFSEFDTIWREPVTFEVEVIEVKSACRAEHKEGERFTFSWRTPEGMCGEAFVGMYPVIFSLRVGGNMKLLGSEHENIRVCNCPGRVVQFKIEAVEQCPLCGNRNDLEPCEILIEETPYTFKICPKCRVKYEK